MIKTAAIVVAAGKGVRMGASMGKQFIDLNGRSILAHTLDIIGNFDPIDKIVLVLSRHDQAHFKKNILPGISLKTPLSIVTGGDTRQASVYNGLTRIDPDTDIVVIHDGVRPFLTHHLINETVNRAIETGAAIPALPVTDTIKRADSGGAIEKTIDRRRLVTVQTPQAFQVAVIKKAHDQACENGYIGTDDAELVEKLGFPVTVVQGSPDNLKITTPRDLVFAEAIIKHRKSTE